MPCLSILLAALLYIYFLLLHCQDLNLHDTTASSAWAAQLMSQVDVSGVPVDLYHLKLHAYQPRQLLLLCSWGKVACRKRYHRASYHMLRCSQEGRLGVLVERRWNPEV